MQKKITLALLISVFTLASAFVVSAQKKTVNNKIWLDKPLVNWNVKGKMRAKLPKPMLAENEKDEDLERLCKSTVRMPETALEKSVVKLGWKLFGALQKYGKTQVFQVMSGYDGMCRPAEYQAFVFHGDEFVGTLSPNSMFSRTDGSLWNITVRDETTINAAFNRYTDKDGLCCPSSTTYVEFEITEDKMPILKPIDRWAFKNGSQIEEPKDKQ